MRIVVLLLFGFITSLPVITIAQQLDGFVTRFITNMVMIKLLFL